MQAVVQTRGSGRSFERGSSVQIIAMKAMKATSLKKRAGVTMPEPGRQQALKATPIVLHEQRRDRLIHEHIHDPYKTRLKLPEPTICPVCGAVYHEGRWQWAATYAEAAHRKTCQACHRIHDRYPAGEIILRGAFVRQHKDEILHLVRHHGAEEEREHPLHRIMQIEELPEVIVITTTDIHLPRRIGEALRSAYKGELRQEYEEETYFVRICWQREE